MNVKQNRAPLKSCELLVLSSQLAILMLGLITFYKLFLGRPTFPEESPMSLAALRSLGALLPSLILIGAFWFRFRWAPTVGTILSLIVLIVLSNLASVALPAIIWIATFFGCVLAVRADFEGVRMTCTAIRPIWKKWLRPLVIVGLAMLLLASPMLLLQAVFSSGKGRGDYIGVAPEGSIATRRSWAKKEMFDYFDLTEKWVRNSTLICDDIGEVVTVAPIGSPNRFVAGGFTDGSHCRMNLQVVGKKGQGVLYLPIVNVNNLYELYEVSEWSSWTCNGQTKLIDHSGKSWVESSEHTDLIKQIRKCASNEDHEGVVRECRLLSEAMRDDEAEENSEFQTRFYFSRQMFVDMPVKFRCEMLTKFGESLAATGGSEEAIEVLIQAAAVAMRNFDDIRRSEIDPRNRQRFAAQWLNIANESLSKANRIDPSHAEVLKLARDRTLRKLQFDVGTSVAHPRQEDEHDEREATQAEKGRLIGGAKYVANESAWLRSQIGEMRIRPGLSQCDLHINEEGYYASSKVSVEIAGSWGRGGILNMRMKELESEVPPLDLFCETPRRPTFNYTFSRVSWEGNGAEDSVRLNAKTLEPRQAKSKRRSNRKQVASK